MGSQGQEGLSTRGRGEEGVWKGGEGRGCLYLRKVREEEEVVGGGGR